MKPTPENKAIVEALLSGLCFKCGARTVVMPWWAVPCLVACPSCKRQWSSDTVMRLLDEACGPYEKLERT